MSDDRESAIDARLRDVPVPAALPDRVAPAVLFDDAAIDRLLSRVEVPAGLADRVRRGCIASRPGLLDGAAEPAAEPRGRPRFSVVRRVARGVVAIAADLGAAAVALGLVAAMFLAGTALSRRMSAPVAARHPVRGERMGPQPAGRETLVPESVRGEPALAVRDARDAPAPQPVSPGSAAGVDMPGPPAAGSRRGDAVAATPFPVDGGVRGAPDTTGWVEQSRSAARKGMRLVTLPQGGRAVPRSKGFDLVFEMTHGESPFVDPAVNPPLAADRPPLGLRTDAFDALVEQSGRESRLRRGRGAAPRKPAGTTGGDGIAVEELLAALPPPWETAAGRPPAVGRAEPARVAIAAVSSLRAEPGSLLVEICVAPPQPARAAAAADTMIVLDASAEAAAPRSWSGMCRGLARIAGRMRPIDRVSVVVCGPRPRLAALRADSAAIRGLVSELETEPPVSGGDLDAAVRLVGSVSRREGAFRDVVIAARADTVARCREDARAAFSAWQDGGEPAAAGSSPAEPRTGFVVIDPQEPSPDPALRTGSSGRVAADTVSIGRALLAEFEGRPTLAGTACRLSVAFDPKTVGSYRIVGFRQTAAEAVSVGDPAAIDMHVGEWARVVYEVVGRPGTAPGGDAVTATFEWIPGGGEAPQRQRAGWKLPAARPLPWPRRELPPPASCELLLAVACGEIAGGSPHAEPRRQSLAAAALVASRWRSRGDVTPMGVLLIEALHRLGMPQEAPLP